jgi:ribose 5-phosphate isomerase B
LRQEGHSLFLDITYQELFSGKMARRRNIIIPTVLNRTYRRGCMRIAVACDHAGFPLKEEVLCSVRMLGHEPVDLGTNSTASVDYPDFAEKIGRAIRDGIADRGVLVCGSGVGACIAANKMDGIYAGLCHDTYSARQGVEHDDMNVLCLGARVIGPALVPELVAAFLNAQFSTDERHRRRVGKIHNLEKNGTTTE